MGRIVIVAALALAVPVAGLAPSPLSAQILDRAGRPLSPEEARRLDAKIAQLRETTGLQAATIAGIARRLGLSYSGLSEKELFSRLEAQVSEAVELRRTIGQLENKVSQLEDPQIRDPGLAIVARAQSAFDDGLFEAAEAQLGQLVFLRQNESSAGLDAWKDAVLSQVAAAELQGREEDFDRAEALLSEAQRAEADRAQLFDLELAAEKMRSRILEGRTFGRRRGLERALGIFKRELQGRVTERAASDTWLTVRLDYARAQMLLGERMGAVDGKEALLAARDELEIFANEVFPDGPDSYPRALLMVMAQSIFASMQVMETEEILHYVKTKNLRALTSNLSLRTGGLDFGMPITAEMLEEALFFWRALIPVMRDPEFVSAIQKTEEYRASGRMAEMDAQKGLNTLAVMFGLYTGLIAFRSVFSLSETDGLIDPAIEPERWADVALTGGTAFKTMLEVRDIDEATARNKIFVAFTEDQIAEIAAMMAREAIKISAAEGLVVLEADSRQLLGDVQRLVYRSAPPEKWEDQLNESGGNLLTAFELRQYDEAPAAWYSSMNSLAYIIDELLNLGGERQCMDLGIAEKFLANPLHAERIDRSPASVPGVQALKATIDRLRADANTCPAS